MAETAVGFVIDHLIPLLNQEANLLKGVHSEVLGIKHELKAIQCVLRDADKKAEAEGDRIRDGVKAWVKQLREVAFQIEDVVDEYAFHLAQRVHPRGFIGALQKVGHTVIKLKPRHQIASQIQDIKAQIREIKERSGRYGFDSLDQHQGSTNASKRNVSRYDPRKGALYLQEADLVGIESPRDELIRLLLDKNPRRTVISTVGMGGLGKTTVAKKVYDSVKEKFDCHAWITVSQSYHKEEMLKGIIQQFLKSNKEPIPLGINELNEDALTRKLRNYLQGKRYIVIFDDVWQVDFWGVIEHALLDNQTGGRVVITTRNMEVANFCKISSFVHIHILQPLPLEKAWELFCKKAFQFEYDPGRCPTNLEKLSLKIVKRCNGLPLAIIAIAGLLSTKEKKAYEWQKLLDSLSSELESNLHLISIKRVLSLSYNDLPYYLKSCFLYLGMYPEDYSIRCSRLIRQWIAEGFVKPRSNKTLEEVAQEYLNELIARSLVQVWVKFDGKARACRIHDLLRDVILSKMEDTRFCHVMSGNESTFAGEGLPPRRLSIINPSCDRDDLQSSANQISKVRSILNFNANALILLENAIMSTSKLLKVLDLEDCPVNSINDDIGNLFHLKYLSLRNTKIKTLPRSIGKLVNLETLDLKQSLVYEIPPEISRLCRLRYLAGYYKDYKMHFCLAQSRGVKLPRGIENLKELQKLHYVEANDMGSELMEELQKLTQLRKVGIYKLRQTDGRSLCECIEKMEYLESLTVYATREDEIIDLESITSAPQFLRCLSLGGRLRRLPRRISKLENLARLYFNWSMLEDDPITILKYLHNLVELGLSSNAYYGEELVFEKGVFPNLKKLRLKDLSRLRSVIIQEGALPNICELSIGPSPYMKQVPSGIQHLRTIIFLVFYDMPPAFVQTIFRNGPSYRVVQHVPRVLVRYALDGGEFKTVRL